jgi:hypothetical protein
MADVLLEGIANKSMKAFTCYSLPLDRASARSIEKYKIDFQ